MSTACAFFQHPRVTPEEYRELTKLRGTAATLPTSPCDGGTATRVHPFVRIGELISNRLYPLEEYSGRFTADDHSQIVICIDKQALFKQPIYSQGALSFGAEVAGRDIEVEGYAQVGKQFDTFDPSTVAADRFLADFRTIFDAATAAQSLLTQQESSEVIEKALQRANTAAAILEGLLTDPARATTVGRILNANPIDLQERRRSLAAAISDYTKARQDADSFQEQTRKLRRVVESAAAALDAIDKEIAAAEAAAAAVTDDAPEASKAAARDRLASARERRAVAAFELARANEAVRDLQSPEDWLRRTRKNLTLSVTDILTIIPDTTKRDVQQQVIDITNRLKDGVISLEVQDINPGDLLQVKLLHFQNFRAADAKEQPEPSSETIALIEVQNYHYRSTVADSFLLIKRVAEKTPEDESNFKGGAGVSLLFSRTPRPIERRFWAPFHPSWGINVSYLDFDPKKELEIGAGPVFGFFKDQVHTGVGWNLNVRDHRFYYFVGFSFAKIKENLTAHPKE
jgi:hypothetical protein